MRTVTVTDYPADELPESMRGLFEAGARVNLRITPRATEGSHPFDVRELFGAGEGLFPTDADLQAHMDELRGLPVEDAPARR